MTSADFDPNSPRYRCPPAGSPQRPYVQPGGLAERFFARLIDGIVVNIAVFVLSLFFFRDSWFLVTGLFSGAMMFGYFVAARSDPGRELGQATAGLERPRPGW